MLAAEHLTGQIYFLVMHWGYWCERMGASTVFNLNADHVVLDFINTLDDRFVPDLQVEKLQTYTDFLRFIEQTRILTAAKCASLARLAKSGNPSSAFHASRNVRELLSRIFYAVVSESEVAGRDLQELNQSLREALPRRILIEEDGRFVWAWNGLDKELQGPLWPIVHEAANLLTSPNLKFVRACDRESCRCLFLDVSKNHSRRWCDMKVCGNRVKARRYYALHGRD